MSAIIRRTINELAARYYLEPELADVYVEGVYDRDLLTAALHEKQRRVVSIYSIDTVDVPVSILASHCLSSGNKQRVIALSKELKRMLDGEYGYVCLVDRDFDHWLGEVKNTRNLRWSKFASLDLHLFREDILYDLICVGCRAKIDNFQVYLRSLNEVLSELYLLRLADKCLEWSMRWITPARCLHLEDGKIIFDSEDYILKLLNKNGRSHFRDEFYQLLDLWRAKLQGEIRLRIRGHDLVNIVAWSIKRTNGVAEVSSESAVYRMFVLMAKNNSDLAAEVCGNRE